MVYSLTALVLTIAVSPALIADWPQFRGPNGSGAFEAADVPVEFSADKNVLWKTNLPPGHSSPVLAGGPHIRHGCRWGEASDNLPQSQGRESSLAPGSAEKPDSRTQPI